MTLLLCHVSSGSLLYTRYHPYISTGHSPACGSQMLPPELAVQQQEINQANEAKKKKGPRPHVAPVPSEAELVGVAAMCASCGHREMVVAAAPPQPSPAALAAIAQVRASRFRAFVARSAGAAVNGIMGTLGHRTNRYHDSDHDGSDSE